ncbi:helix-turn-helix domain-containing protein [Bacillus sp. UNC41MFS5]|uniref:helix-turn-helix domain-containing protein n=1 Tax=Bacillus sp. UNC41MFS5 TaxID=1449046 RepID=UPI00047E1FDB|nr:helix-turn-helix domain-containing protein [Bacillus sp. UNC41MFS5]
MPSLSDIQLRIQNIEYSSTTIYSGLEILLVLDGELVVETDRSMHQLHVDHLFVINRNQPYEIRAIKKNTVLKMSIPDSFLSHFYPEYRFYTFNLFSPEIDRGKENTITELRKLLAEIMVIYFRKEEGYKLEMSERISKILLILIRRFKADETIDVDVDVEDERLKGIIAFIEQHYDEPLTLEEVANKFYLSFSYFSRYFKKQLGIGFTRYMMNIRLKHSLKDLLYTNDSITYIALKHGFPNAKAFTNLFKEVYGETPFSYREKNAKEHVKIVQNYHIEDKETLLSSPEILIKLRLLIAKGEDTKTISDIETNFESITIDIQSPPKRKLHHPDNLLMIGELRELQKESVRNQVLLAKEDLQIKYIGIHKLLTGRTIAPDVETDELIPTTSPYYNSDAAIEFLKANHLSLYVHVRYNPIAAEQEAYLEKLQRFFKHCVTVFGYSYVESWCIMINDALDFHPNQKELELFYFKIHGLLKSMMPNLRLGVFLPFSFKQAAINSHYHWVLHQSEYLDFIAFQANTHEIIDYQELNDTSFDLAKDFIKEKTEKLKRYLKHHSIEKPLHLITWNTISGNTRYTNGTFFRGALVFNDAISISDTIETLGFWINTETHEKSLDMNSIPLEGMEMFHYFNGKRPVFFAMSFFNRLRGNIIARGPLFIMTENELGYQLVLMNSTIINPFLSIEDSFLQKLMKEMRVTINGIPSGKYQIRKFIFDKNHGALYKLWWENNSEFGIDREIIDYITRSSHPSLEVFDETIDGVWTMYSYLTVNAIHFFEIRKVFF